MAEPFVGEIRMGGYNFAPRRWAACDGQLLPINQNQALFSLLGTTYGGDGRTTFALPDLRGRIAVHWGTGPEASVVLGEKGGLEAVTLGTSEMPAHQHALQASAELANGNMAAGALPAARGRGGPLLYAAPGGATVAMDPAAVTATGGSQPHDNMQPYLALNYVIALSGLFPSRN